MKEGIKCAGNCNHDFLIMDCITKMPISGWLVYGSDKKYHVISDACAGMIKPLFPVDYNNKKKKPTKKAQGIEDCCVSTQEFTKATTMSSLTSKLPTKTKAQLFDRIIELYWEHGPLGLRIQTSEDGDELRVWTDTNVRTDFSLLFKAPI